MTLLRTFISPLLCLALLVPGGPAYARIVSTETAVLDGQRMERIDRIQVALARSDVTQAMIALGVNPTDAAQRVAGLTDAELARLDGQLGKLPAGSTSLLAVIGIVAVVLIILELVGAINIFNKI